MDKYVIRNCPYFFEENEEVNDYTCSWFGTEELACQDCTDCVIKQIVELCEHYKKYIDCKADCPSFRMFLSKLLSKLDIQEVE